ncbi:hypothetical protein K501DRAFT_257804 [Backusella circina FSU 941]|nr:hypothetical protein K501DRAFT_257804 [Backusella circina FSU 941]
MPFFFFFFFFRDSTCTLGDVEQHLRACLLKLGTCNSILQANTSPCTFRLSVEKANGGYPNENLDVSCLVHVDWVPNDEDDNNNIHFGHIIPLKLVSMDILQVNTFIYEAKKKGKEREQAPMH